MKVITDKSHLLVCGNVRVTAKIDNSYIESEKEQMLLGIMIFFFFLSKHWLQCTNKQFTVDKNKSK